MAAALSSSQLMPLSSLFFDQFGLGSWVVGSGIVEFSIVVLLGEVLSHGTGNSEEVGHMDGVGDVGVKVVLEVLEHVHVLVDVVISSDSWEGESSVVEFPGVDLKFWVNSLLLSHGLGDVQDVSPVSWVEGSGEHIDLVVEFFLSLIKVFAWLLDGDLGIELNEGIFVRGAG